MLRPQAIKENSSTSSEFVQLLNADNRPNCPRYSSFSTQSTMPAITDAVSQQTQLLSAPTYRPDKRPVVEQLRYRLKQVELQWRDNKPLEIVSSGCPQLDRMLPDGGFRRGSLVEWLSPGHGTGAMQLALIAARTAAMPTGKIAVLDRQRQFYPPAAVKLGILPEQLLIVQPATSREELWALDQLLRSGGVDAVLARIDRIDPAAYRRLQLAAEEGASLGLFLRKESACDSVCWAHVRLAIEPLPGSQSNRWRRLRIRLLRCRGQLTCKAATVLEVSDAADCLSLPTQLASAAPSPCATRA